MLLISSLSKATFAFRYCGTNKIISNEDMKNIRHVYEEQHEAKQHFTRSCCGRQKMAS